MTEKEELLAKIKSVCYNDDTESISFDSWEKLTIEQLRSVVILLDNDMVKLLNATQGTKGHCYLLQNIYKWISTPRPAIQGVPGSQQPPRNPATNVDLSDRQLYQIEAENFCGMIDSISENPRDREDVLVQRMKVLLDRFICNRTKDAVPDYNVLGMCYEYRTFWHKYGNTNSPSEIIDLTES